MRERLDLKRFAQTAILAAAVAGCASPATKSPDQSTNSTPTPGATETFSPTPRPTPTITETPRATEKPKPTEIALSMEQQAANAVFDYWYALLNETQSLENGIDQYYLKTSIQNLGQWQHNIDTIKRGGQSSSTLVVNWVGGEVYPASAYTTGKFQAIKTQGVMALEEINLSATSVPIINSDKSKGITWKGKATLDFKTSWAENQFWPTQDTPYVSLDKAKAWVLKPEPDPYWESMPITELETKNIDVFFQNGQWIVNPGNSFSSNELGDPLSGVQKPSFVMSDQFFCNPNASSSCQVIRKKLSY